MRYDPQEKIAPLERARYSDEAHRSGRVLGDTWREERAIVGHGKIEARLGEGTRYREHGLLRPGEGGATDRRRSPSWRKTLVRRIEDTTLGLRARPAAHDRV